jgi:hypothetical protein
MSGPKVLNLDELETGNEKEIVLDGKTYKLQPFSVGDFIDQVKRLEAAENVSSSEAFELIVEMVSKAFPGLSEETIRGMSMERLNAIYDFVRATTEEEISEGNV